MFTAMGYNNYTSGAGKYSDVSMEGAANRLYQLDYGIKFQVKFREAHPRKSNKHTQTRVVLYAPRSGSN